MEHRPAHQKVVGSIPHHGTYLGCRFDPQLGHIREAIDQYFSLSKKLISMSLGEDFLKIVIGVWN